MSTTQTQTQTGNTTDQSTDNLLKALTAEESPELTMKEKAALYDQFKEDYCSYNQDLQWGDINSLMRFRFAYEDLMQTDYASTIIKAINKQIQALLYVRAAKDSPSYLNDLIDTETLCNLSTFLAEIEDATHSLSPKLD